MPTDRSAHSVLAEDSCRLGNAGRDPGEIENGRGFVLLRGISRARYDDAECELLYWGLGVHLGAPVSQNARGHVLGHVRDEGRIIADPNARAYQTNQRMDFHTDMLPVDVLGLFCLRTAKSGGASKLVSALTIHNVLRAERPIYRGALAVHVDWRVRTRRERPGSRCPCCGATAGTSRINSLPYYDSAARTARNRPSASSARRSKIRRSPTAPS
jgi:hypothetical protein